MRKEKVCFWKMYGTTLYNIVLKFYGKSIYANKNLVKNLYVSKNKTFFIVEEFFDNPKSSYWTLASHDEVIKWCVDNAFTIEEVGLEIEHKWEIVDAKLYKTKDDKYFLIRNNFLQELTFGEALEWCMNNFGSIEGFDLSNTNYKLEV